MENKLKYDRNSLNDHSIFVQMKEQLQGKSILVTGGTGMIGREVVRLLADSDCDVTSVSLDDLELDPRVKYIKGDLTDLNFCLDICSGIEHIIHTAGIKGSVVVTKERPSSFFVPLLMMNTNVLEAARRNKVLSTVYTSSIGAYSSAEIFIETDSDFTKPPMDHYPGWAKRIAEMQIEAYRIEYGLENFSIVRPSNIFGPGDNFDPENAMVIPSLISKIIRGDNPLRVWGDGSAERDFLFSTDAAVGIILACINGTKSKVVNLGSGKSISIKELVETLQEILTFKVEFDLTKSAGFPKRVMDMTLARETIGFEPSYSLKEGLMETISWYKNNLGSHLKKKNYFR